jgi:hypothetical protein
LLFCKSMAIINDDIGFTWPKLCPCRFVVAGMPLPQGWATGQSARFGRKYRPSHWVRSDGSSTSYLLGGVSIPREATCRFIC